MMLPTFPARTLLAVPLVGAALAVPHAQPAQAATVKAPQVLVASATARDFRLVITATQASGGSAPTATADVTAYVRTGSGWHRRGEVQLGRAGRWFWDTLQGGRAVRDFTISNNSPDRGSVQLLLTPALGWSSTYHFHMANGQLIR
jgi:hypothetical protein